MNHISELDLILASIVVAPGLIGAVLILSGIRRIMNAEGGYKILESVIGAVALPLIIIAIVVAPLYTLAGLFPMKGRRARPGEIDTRYNEQWGWWTEAHTGGSRIMAGVLLVFLAYVLPFDRLWALIEYLLSTLDKSR